MNELIYWTGMVAVASVAASGAIEAGRRPNIDMFGALVVGLAAAVGGGSLRDVLLNRPVFWITDQTYLFVAIGSAVVASVAVHVIALPMRLFLFADAIGLSLFTVLGTKIALSTGTPWFAASFLGVVTGVFGGILRDVLCNEVPIVFNSELYATAAWGGSLTLTILASTRVDPVRQAAISGTVVLALRLGALRSGWRLPLAYVQPRS